MKNIIKNNKKHTIYFDMDGTLCDIYSDPNWLKKIEKENISIFKNAKPMIDINKFTRCCKLLKNKGYNIGIISYLPWESSFDYKRKIKKIKQKYLETYFNNIKFDKIFICVNYIPKELFANKGDVLFDDDIRNRKNWNKGKAYTHNNIIKKLKNIYHI